MRAVRRLPSVFQSRSPLASEGGEEETAKGGEGEQRGEEGRERAAHSSSSNRSELCKMLGVAYRI